MPARSQAIERVTVFTGQKSGLPPELLRPQDSSLLYNMIIRQGKPSKIPGYTLYHSASYGSGKAFWLGRYKHKWVYQRECSVYIEDSEDAGTFTKITDDLTAAKILSDIWRDKLYMVNGYEQKFYDGSNLKDIGLYPPGNGIIYEPSRDPFAFSVTGSAGSLGSGTYKYIFVYYDSTTKTLSLPWGSMVGEDGVFNHTEYTSTNTTGFIPYSVTVSANDAVNLMDTSDFSFLTNNPPSRADKYRIYRTKVGGSDYYFLAERDIGDDSVYVDKVADSTLTELYTPSEFIPPPNKTAIENAGGTVNSGFVDARFWRDSLYLLGLDFESFSTAQSGGNFPIDKDVNESDSMLFASDSFLPDYYPFNYEIGKGDGQKATALGVVGSQLAVFKERSIYQLIGTSLDNYVVRIVDTVHGCVHAATLQETKFGIICLSHVGVVLFRGNAPAKVISDDIKDEIEELNYGEVANFSSAYDQYNDLYYLQCVRGTSSLINRTLIYNVKEDSWSVSRGREGSSIHFASGSDNKVRGLIGTQTGLDLYKIDDEDVVTNNGNTMLSRYRSGQFVFGDPTKQKKAKWLYVTAQCKENFVINVALYCDYSQGSVYEQNGINSSSAYATYASASTDDDGAIYDTSRYSSKLVQKTIKIPVFGVGRSFRVEIEEANTDAGKGRFTILAVSLEAIVLGR